MKKIITVTAAILAAILFSSCKDNCPEDETCEIPLVFKVDPGGLVFGAEDTELQSFYVTSLNVGWTAEVEASAQEWLKINVEADKITVRVEQNTMDEARSGKIIVTPDHEALLPVEVNVTQLLTETLRVSMTCGILLFAGDEHGCGLSNYLISFGGGDAIYDPEQVTISIEFGEALVLDVLAEEISSQNYQVIELKEGTYQIGMSPKADGFAYEKMTFLPTIQHEGTSQTAYSGSWFLHFVDGMVTENTVLTDGKVTVERNGDEHLITAEFVTDFGQRILVDYTGSFDAKESGVSLSTYTEDRDLNELSAGTLSSVGPMSYAPGTNFWVASLQTPELENGAEVYIALYSPQNDLYVLDSGEYRITFTQPFLPFTVEGGWDLYGYSMMTWVYEFGEEVDWDLAIQRSPLVSGTVTVQHNEGNNYTIEVDAYMDNYFKLTALFEGDLEFYEAFGVNSVQVPYRLREEQRPAHIPKTIDPMKFYRSVK